MAAKVAGAANIAAKANGAARAAVAGNIATMATGNARAAGLWSLDKGHFWPLPDTLQAGAIFITSTYLQVNMSCVLCLFLSRSTSTTIPFLILHYTPNLARTILRELSFFTGMGGLSVCDRGSPIFSVPPLCIRKKNLVPHPLPPEKNFAPPLAL